MDTNEVGYEKAIAWMLKQRLAGAAWKIALSTPSGKLSHSQAERAEMRLKMWFYAVDPASVQGDWSEIHVEGEPTPENIGKVVAKYRDQNVSWGVIGERMSISETRVRSCFEQAKSIHSKGLRTGHGGRFVQDRADLYAETPSSGVIIPKDVKIEDVEGAVQGKAVVEGSVKAEPKSAKATATKKVAATK